jgi:hypothetical protein
LLLIALACVPAVWTGTGMLAPQLRATWRALHGAWGPVLAQQWATGALVLAGACSLPRLPASGTLPDRLLDLPVLGSVLAACGRMPIALVGHLLALGGWLLLLLPLAVAVVLCTPIREGSAASAWHSSHSGPWLLPGTLLWLASPLATICWAPVVAGLCLCAGLARRGASMAGPRAPGDARGT